MDDILKTVLVFLICAAGVVCFATAGYLWRKQKTNREKKAESGEQTAGRGIFKGKTGYGAVAAVALVVLITIAAMAATYFHKERTSNDDIPRSTMPGAVGSTEDLFPNKWGDMLWDLLYGGTHGGEGTVAEKLEIKVEAIQEMLDAARNEEGYFDFPEGFRLHSAMPDSELKKADTLEAYDRQLAYQVAGKNYYWTTNIALSCLDLCTRTGKRDVALYEYYAKLAVWGLANRYVSMGEEPRPTRLVDLYYWAGQTFDHLGGAVADDARQDMYLVSAAFLELAARALKASDFQGNVVEPEVCWELYLTMLERLDLEMDSSAGHDMIMAVQSRHAP